MKKIFQKNALIATAYTFFLTAISFLFNNDGQAVILGFVLAFVATIHFLILQVLMVVKHFKLLYDQRNGYLLSSGFIWLLYLIVNVCRFLIK